MSQIENLAHQVFFAGFAALAVALALLVVIGRNPVASAVFLIGKLFVVACLYALMGAHFAATIQVLVYAGAIMVLFLFVIMLLNLRPDGLAMRWLPLPEIGVLLLTIAGFLVVGVKLLGDSSTGVVGPYSLEAIEASGGNTVVIGLKMLTTYVWPFELVAVLILLAIVASILIARKPSSDTTVKGPNA